MNKTKTGNSQIDLFITRLIVLKRRLILQQLHFVLPRNPLNVILSVKEDPLPTWILLLCFYFFLVSADTLLIPLLKERKKGRKAMTTIITKKSNKEIIRNFILRCLSGLFCLFFFFSLSLSLYFLYIFLVKQHMGCCSSKVDQDEVRKLY